MSLVHNIASLNCWMTRTWKKQQQKLNKFGSPPDGQLLLLRDECSMFEHLLWLCLLKEDDPSRTGQEAVRSAPVRWAATPEFHIFFNDLKTNGLFYLNAIRLYRQKRVLFVASLTFDGFPLWVFFWGGIAPNDLYLFSTILLLTPSVS